MRYQGRCGVSSPARAHDREIEFFRGFVKSRNAQSGLRSERESLAGRVCTARDKIG